MSKTKPTQTNSSVKSTECIVNYPAALCRQQKTKSDNSTFRSVSFKDPSDSWATFAISEDSVHQSVRRNGEVIPNVLTIDLGDSEDIRFVSVRTGDNCFERKPFFNKTIKTLIDNGKKAYLRSIAI